MKNPFLISYGALHHFGFKNLLMLFILSDRSSVYTDKKFLYSSTMNKIHIKDDVIDGSVVNGIREPILFSFILDKPSGYKVFCEPETIH